MYTTEFDYHRASSVEEALGLMAQHPDAKVLAGGHSLVPTMKLRLASPPTLIDISRIQELRGIRLQGDSVQGDMVVIGAGTTHREIEFSDELKRLVPLLPEVATHIGDPMVRNRGTIGGSVAHADPAADYPASLLALGAKFKLVSQSGERVVEASAFFQGMFQTDAREGELLTEIHIPVHAGAGMAYEKFPHPASHYAIVGVAAVVSKDGQVRVAYTGAGPNAARLSKVEQALSGGQMDDAALESATQDCVDASELLGDHFAGPEYRAHLIGVHARRAIKRAKASVSA